MSFIKSLLRGLSSHLFKLFILLLAVVSALVFTFHSPKKIEKSLSDSGVYSTFVDSALQEVKKSNDSSSTGNNVPIDDPTVKTAANQAFTPQLLQNSTESLLNGTYEWLSGKTKTPVFSIDLTQAKQTFAQAVGAAAGQRAASLPVCTTAQLKQLNPDVDLFSVPCKPANLNIAAQQAKLVNNLQTNKDFLGTTSLNASNLPKDSNGQTAFDKLSQAPKIYKWVSASPWLLAVLVVLTGGATVLLYESKRRGLRNVAISLGSTGTLLIILSLASSWVLHKANTPSGALGSTIKGSFQQTAIKGINSISNSIEQTIIWFGVSYLIIAILTLAILHFTKPKRQTAEPAKKEPTPTDVNPKSEPKYTPKPIQG